MNASRYFAVALIFISLAFATAFSADDFSQLKELERQTWEVYAKKDLAGLKALLAPDYLFSDGESIQNWQQVVDSFAAENITSYKLSDMQALKVSPDVVVLTYTAEQKGTFEGKDISGPLSVASVWAKRGGKWLSVYVHEVPLANKEAATTPAESKDPMQLKVDHVGICAYELRPMQDAFAAVGLSTEYGGVHATGGTHNALLGFNDGSYLELIAPQHPETLSGDEAKEWDPLKPDRGATCFWAIGTSDIAARVAGVRQAGFKISDVQAGSRTKPDGTLLKWQTAAVPGNEGGDILPFLIQDVTSRSDRIQPSPSVKDSELRGVEVVILGVNDLDASVALYRRVFGLQAPAVTTDSALRVKMAHFTDTPVMLASPLDANSWIAQAISKYGQSPVAILLGTKDFAKSTQRFKLSGETSLFGKKIAWFDAGKLHGARIGVVE
ncbi:MAG TPA: VOC family protein [Terriglobales bacterium]